MEEVWAIWNECGRWLIRLGDRVAFRDCFTLQGQVWVRYGVVKDRPRLSRSGVITHLKVWCDPIGDGEQSPILVGAHNVVSVDSKSRPTEAGTTN